MQIGDRLYARYVGNIRHWSRELFAVGVTWIGTRHFTVAINGVACRFERTSLRHDNQGRRPAYQLFLTLAAYEQETELAELKHLLSRTNLLELSVEKQRAIKVIIES